METLWTVIKSLASVLINDYFAQQLMLSDSVIVALVCWYYWNWSHGGLRREREQGGETRALVLLRRARLIWDGIYYVQQPSLPSIPPRLSQNTPEIFS